MDRRKIIEDLIAQKMGPQQEDPELVAAREALAQSQARNKMLGGVETLFNAGSVSVGGEGVDWGKYSDANNPAAQQVKDLIARRATADKGKMEALDLQRGLDQEDATKVAKDADREADAKRESARATEAARRQALEDQKFEFEKKKFEAEQGSIKEKKAADLAKTQAETQKIVDEQALKTQEKDAKEAARVDAISRLEKVRDRLQQLSHQGEETGTPGQLRMQAISKIPVVSSVGEGLQKTFSPGLQAVKQELIDAALPALKSLGANPSNADLALFVQTTFDEGLPLKANLDKIDQKIKGLASQGAGPSILGPSRQAQDAAFVESFGPAAPLTQEQKLKQDRQEAVRQFIMKGRRKQQGQVIP